ncbi:nickel pincer cofactor biosynthesis protein LarC [Phormidium yuhuli AB48]|uniref:Putative nickel insertion protein n=1 Tax=Phormidium yuhuli AB48 TaxID=2940671 RepID=A0ABY5AUX6_9CYAN|nr:nickel pincer cofactor biosynthesis protein LarC [Phormidium yuhuli]USR91938.1 nickel pincer cofactor biosynthesis protein LarC [Phormidium yuhuli AB48]
MSSRIAYFDCPTGIAGDMCLGALLDAGVPLEYLEQQLGGLGLGGAFRLRPERVQRQGQDGLKLHVELAGVAEEPPTVEGHHHHHDTRHLPEIETLIQGANLSQRARDWSLQVFRRLADAEGSVHGISPDRVHFHEVGAVDAIVDIVGTCVGLDWLGVDRILCSALPSGGGTVKAAHGQLPVPVPAVLKLFQMRGVMLYDNGIRRELVTPTGAALMVTLAESFGQAPAMQLQQTGLGAGTQDLAIPNLLRLWVGETEESPWGSDRVCVLQTQLDDIPPQAIGYTCDRLFEMGALDVFTQGIQMKKSRPGILLTVICPPEKQRTCETVIFQETTTLGIRQTLQPRSLLKRHIETVELDGQPVRLKIASDATGARFNVQPEYEDIAAIARQQKRPWYQVHQQALQTWHNHQA